MNYKSSCHCGKIAFEVEGELNEVIECNCSYCRRKGYLLWFVKRDRIKMSTPESNLAKYQFNKHVINHYFCPTCGCSPFGEGVEAMAGMAAVNVRCLEGVEPSALKINQYDGRSK